MPQLIGTAPSQIPTNGHLGSAAFLDSSAFYGTGVSASFRNKFINGDMRIDQRNAGASITMSTGNELFAVDRTMSEQGGATSNTGTIQQVTDGPAGFNKSLKYTAGSSSYGANGYVAINQRIEGQNVQDLAFGTSSAQSITLSFWVKSSLVGTYTNNITHYNGTTERWNNQTYTINVANTWEYKTLTFVGDTFSGPSNNTTGFMRVYWHLGGDAGAATTTSFNTWFNGTGSKRAATTQTNLLATSGATFFLTGIQLERGTVATPFEHRPFAIELASCMRYFYAIKSTGVANGDATGLNGVVGGNTAVHRSQAPHPVIMRATPSLTFSNTSTVGTDLRVYDAGVSPNISSVGSNFSNANAIQFDSTASGGGLTTGRAATILWSNSITGGYIWVSAEL